MSVPKLFLVAVIGCVTSTAVAEESQQNPPPRYSFQRVEDGFLRLDNVSGQVSICSARAVGWACQAVPEDRAALEREIARLQEEVEKYKDQVANLMREVAALREPPPPRPPADLSPPPSDDTKRLREDLERARTAFENAWRRLVEMLVNFQKDMMHKS